MESLPSLPAGSRSSVVKSFLLILFLWFVTVPSLGEANRAGGTASADDGGAHARMVAGYGKLPLSFEANRGQVDSRVQFVCRGQGIHAFFSDLA
jgi:hypothetical protein